MENRGCFVTLSTALHRPPLPTAPCNIGDSSTPLLTIPPSKSKQSGFTSQHGILGATSRSLTCNHHTAACGEGPLCSSLGTLNATVDLRLLAQLQEGCSSHPKMPQVPEAKCCKLYPGCTRYTKEHLSCHRQSKKDNQIQQRSRGLPHAHAHAASHCPHPSASRWASHTAVTRPCCITIFTSINLIR
jgi:hypothetical protein